MLYINKYLTQDIKLANLAALLGMSKFYLSHLFKEAIGTAPYEYLLQQRILIGEAVVKTKRAIDYRNCLIGVASIATAI